MNNNISLDANNILCAFILSFDSANFVYTIVTYATYMKLKD